MLEKELDDSKDQISELELELHKLEWDKELLSSNSQGKTENVPSLKKAYEELQAQMKSLQISSSSGSSSGSSGELLMTARVWRLQSLLSQTKKVLLFFMIVNYQ